MILRPAVLFFRNAQNESSCFRQIFFRLAKVIEHDESNIVSSKKSPFVCHQLLAKSGQVATDFYRFYFRHYGKTAFAANVANSIKYLWLEEGELTIHLASQSVGLKAGQMTTFSAAIPHRFESRAGALAKGVFLVTYH